MTPVALSRRTLLGAGAALAAAPLAACAAAAEDYGAFRVKIPNLRLFGLKVHYFVPADAPPDAEVLVVMHGRYRDPQEYLEPWIAPARAAGAILLAPEFDENRFDGSIAYNQGGVQDERGRWRPKPAWTFSLVEVAFDAFCARTGRAPDGYSLYGHSAGAQFVHRYLALMPEARVRQAIAANAGWYTFPTREAAWPYGLGGAPVSDEALRAYFGKPLVVLLGGADDDALDENLQRTEGAMRQGPHRLARGLAFFETAQAEAERLGAPLAWRLEVAPGVAHDNYAMSQIAARTLLGGDLAATEAMARR